MYFCAMNCKPVITEDGSHTLFVPELNEHYHSTHGAIQESRHIFIDAGWDAIFDLQSPVKIFEVGFGTGLNALLTSLEAREYHRKTFYVTVEAFPVNPDLIAQLNYPVKLQQDHASVDFEKLHAATWNIPVFIHDQFIINKISVPLAEAALANDAFHLIYFDAFAPEVQPELWTAEIFEKMYNALLPGGVLVTYCAKGSVKRALKSAGFIVENLPGPPGKREITRARKEV